MRWILPVAALSLAACEQQASPAPASQDEITEPAAVGPTPITQKMADAQGIPAPFIGVWDYVEGSCLPESDLRMEIRPRRIVFYESVGDVSSVEIVNPETIKVAMALSGEGETWEETLTLELAEGGSVLLPTNEGGADPMARKRCE